MLSAPGGGGTAAESLRLPNSPFLFDLRAVGVFRVLLALTILADQVVRAADWHAFHGASGLLSLADSRAWASSWEWSLYWLSDGPLLPYVLEGLRFAATVTLLAGVRSRLSALVLFVLLASVAARNPLLLQSGDKLLTVMTFFAAFLPLGARFSLERLWFGTDAATTYRSAATVAFAVQVLLVWFMSGVLKTADEWHGAGTAISLALHLEAFTSELARLWRDLDWLTHSLTRFVFWLECIAPCLALLPSYRLRLVGLGALVALEVGIALSLEVGLFWVISLVSLVPLMPVRLADRLFGRGEEGTGVVMFYDARCRFCAFACRLLRAVGALPHAALKTAQSDAIARGILEGSNSWSVADERGGAREYRRGWDAVRAVLGIRRPWLLKVLPGPERGQRLYDWIGAHRDRFGAVGALSFGSGPGQHGEIGRFVVSCALVTVLAWNVASYPAMRQWKDMRGLVRPLAATSHLEQFWGMFAPSPPREDSWHAIPALGLDGRQVDLLTGEAIVLAPPVDGPARYGSYRWRKTIRRSVAREEVARVLRYHCRTGDWSAMDLWEFERPNPGAAGVAPQRYSPRRVERERCRGADDRAVDEFQASVDAMMASYAGR